MSLGAQTFDPRALERLGRIHSAEDTHRAVAELRAAKLDNFNLDLMYALPEQSLQEALDDVRIACALAPSHISYYQFTLEPGTVFHSRPPPLPDEDAAWQIQCAGQKLLAAAGYVQYEVSAYAREGARCRHNLNYWLFGDYLGIGAGAHGKLSLSKPAQILRTVKPKQPREYQARRWRAAKARYIAVKDLPFEFMLNALRLNEGFTDDRLPGSGPGSHWIRWAKACRAPRSAVLWLNGPMAGSPRELGRRFLNDLQASFLA